jgi:hypothetical protein
MPKREPKHEPNEAAGITPELAAEVDKATEQLRAELVDEQLRDLLRYVRLAEGRLNAQEA